MYLHDKRCFLSSCSLKLGLGLFQFFSDTFPIRYTIISENLKPLIDSKKLISNSTWISPKVLNSIVKLIVSSSINRLVCSPFSSVIIWFYEKGLKTILFNLSFYINHV